MPNENTQKIEQFGSAQEHSEEASGSYSRLQQTQMEIPLDRPRTKEQSAVLEKGDDDRGQSAEKIQERRERGKENAVSYEGYGY
jgi:hypothetical protein